MASSTGVMFATDRLDAAAYAGYGRRVEATGLDTIWVPELFGREPMAASAFLLGVTSTVRVATGIANVYVRDAVAAAQAARTLGELHPGRFALGLGVSNADLVGSRGHRWQPPVEKLTAYLDAMDAATLWSPPPPEPVPVYVAAHGPKMLAVAAERADGVNTWLMTPEHTARTAAALDDGAVLTVGRMCLLCDDPEEARRLARRAVGMYVGLDYYHRAWSALGFGPDDFADGGSDRLIDTLVAWGDGVRIRDQIQSHRDAGATHIMVVPLNRRGGAEPDWELLEAVV